MKANTEGLTGHLSPATKKLIIYEKIDYIDAKNMFYHYLEVL